MSQYKLSDIARQIAIQSFLKETRASYEDVKEILAYMYKKVDIIGTDNRTLRNPLNLDKSVFYFRDREGPLTGQEMVTGDYLVFDYVGHSEDMFITQFNSINEIEEKITGGGGITNPFTTYQIAIVMGRFRQYNITFTNGVDGQEYDFAKKIHDAMPEYQSIFDKEKRPETRRFQITNVKIHWLD